MMRQSTTRSALALAVLIGAAPRLEAQPQPSILNGAEVQRMLRDAYPKPLRDQDVNTVTYVRLYVAPGGTVDSVHVVRSSGLLDLDAAARETAEKVRFSGVERARTIDLPLSFTADDAMTLYAPPVRARPADEELDESYPLDLRAEGIGAEVGLSLLLDSSGRPVEPTVISTSCLDAADRIAIALVQQLAFAPATPDDNVFRRTYATVRFHHERVELTVFGDEVKRDTIKAMSGSHDDRQGETRAPSLKNRNRVARTLVANYPPDLRDRGIGGSPTLRIYVDEEGRVAHRVIARGSGICRLDRAALEVADAMQFEPALHDGTAVAVWVQIPVIFRVK